MANTSSPADTEVRTYCCEQNPGESLWGTADQVDVWLCLEYRPAWKGRALTDNALAPRIRSWLEETVAGLRAVGLRARPQFIRQPQLDGEDVRLLVTAGGRTVQFSGRGYDFLLQLNLAAQLGDGGVFGDGGEELTGPRYLVCTNGQRDLCCARFGLPLYTSLAERFGDRVWQVTHLGGHRFAPNVLTLPDACLYGRVSLESVDEFVTRIESGDIDFTRLRGRTCHTPIVQAAEAALGRPGARLLHVEGSADEAVVQFALRGERVSVALKRAETGVRVQKSCGDEAFEVMHPFVRA